ncbi:uncharacterized protein LOC109838283 [Asparagus officinalis]|uniref:uncharacterized protein LOC109838283 n=1 Tax=Asparagus officinalis TaxID=4686 RepID=UPI00098E1B30|nr:uncharacterized protein LOC109838283 [Asparagus officinalis]
MWKQLLKVRDTLISKFGNVYNLHNAINKCCSGGKIIISSIYKEIAQHSPKVHWSDTVWDNWNFPKHSFILWLAIHAKLLTQDMLCHLGILDTNVCVLCSNQRNETCQHLLFECQYSVEAWNNMMNWLEYKWRSCSWESIIDWYSNKLRGKGFMKKLKRLALSATVYAIWIERNQRIFQQKFRAPAVLFRNIKISILSKILNDKIHVYIKEKIERL